MVIFVKSHQTTSTSAYVAKKRGYVDCQVKDTLDCLGMKWVSQRKPQTTTLPPYSQPALQKPPVIMPRGFIPS